MQMLHSRSFVFPEILLSCTTLLILECFGLSKETSTDFKVQIALAHSVVSYYNTQSHAHTPKHILLNHTESS